MGILPYTEEHKKFRKRVRTFAKKEISPYVEQWEKNRGMPRSVWKRMGEEGFLCTSYSPEYGGIGGNFLHTLIITEEFIRAGFMDPGFSGHSDIMSPYIYSFGSKEIKKKYIPGCISGDLIVSIAMTEPDTGSDVAAITTTAVESGDEVVINGSKIFITNGINCDLAVVAAKDPAIKKPLEAISLYVVETGTPGFEKGKKLDKMGMHTQDTAELFFNNCCVPVKNRLGEKGKGFYLLMQKLQQERLVLSTTAMVAAEYILEKTMEYYKLNSSRKKALSQSQAKQFALVEMATEVKLGRNFFDKLVADHVENKNVIIETSMAKFWISRMALRVAVRCIDLFGESAISEACPIIRYWRDLRAYPIVGGTDEIMKTIVAKFMNI